MNIESIQSELRHLLAMVDEWRAEGVASAIERDILLDRIKGLYEQLRFSQAISFDTPSTPPMDMESESTAAEVEVELTYYEGDDEEEEQEIIEDTTEEQEQEQTEAEEDDMPLITFSLEDITILPETEPELEVVEVSAPEPTPEPELTPEPTEQPLPKTENALFDLDTIPVRQRSRRSAILSLYSDTPLPKKEPQKEVHEPTPSPMPLDIVDEIFMDDDTEEPQSVKIAEGVEVVNSVKESIIIPQEPTVETIADHYASQREDITVSDKAIGRSSINDRYTIAQDLFAGEMSGYETLMRKLSGIDNFEDCMIYITENYNWDADQDAVKLVVKLLEQRFSLS